MDWSVAQAIKPIFSLKKDTYSYPQIIRIALLEALLSYFAAVRWIWTLEDEWTMTNSVWLVLVVTYSSCEYACIDRITSIEASKWNNIRFDAVAFCTMWGNAQSTLSISISPFNCNEYSHHNFEALRWISFCRTYARLNRRREQERRKKSAT